MSQYIRNNFAEILFLENSFLALEERLEMGWLKLRPDINELVKKFIENLELLYEKENYGNEKGDLGENFAQNFFKRWLKKKEHLQVVIPRFKSHINSLNRVGVNIHKRKEETFYSIERNESGSLKEKGKWTPDLNFSVVITKDRQDSISRRYYQHLYVEVKTGKYAEVGKKQKYSIGVLNQYDTKKTGIITWISYDDKEHTVYLKIAKTQPAPHNILGYRFNTIT